MHISPPRAVVSSAASNRTTHQVKPLALAIAPTTYKHIMRVHTESGKKFDSSSYLARATVRAYFRNTLRLYSCDMAIGVIVKAAD